MNTATLEFPPIDAPPPAADLTPVAAAVSTALATVDLAKLDLTTVALAQFGDWRKEAQAARDKLDGLVLDLSNQARIEEAKALRWRLIGQPRADVRKTSKALKSKLAQVSKAIGAEEDEAVKAYDAIEGLISPKIDDAEAAIARAKAEAARLDAERLAGLRTQAIDMFAPWVDRCKEDGITAERIGAGIAALYDVAMPAELNEVSGHWANAKAAAHAAMVKLQAEASQREAAERLRLVAEEQASQAEALAARERALAEQAAELARQAEELAAAQRAAEQAKEAERLRAEAHAKAEADRVLAEQRAESDRLEALAEANRAALAAAAAPVVMEPAPAPLLAQDECRPLSQALASKPDAPMHAREAAAAIVQPSPAPEPARLTLDELDDRLGFFVNQTMVDSLLGYVEGHPQGGMQASQFGLLCVALMNHVQRVRTTYED